MPGLDPQRVAKRDPQNRGSIYAPTLAAVAAELPRAGRQTFLAGSLMGAGVWLHLTERPDHEHDHEVLEHSHVHVHDEHHQDAHNSGTPPGEPHRHPHVHGPLRPSHPTSRIFTTATLTDSQSRTGQRDMRASAVSLARPWRTARPPAREPRPIASAPRPNLVPPKRSGRDRIHPPRKIVSGHALDRPSEVRVRVELRHPRGRRGYETPGLDFPLALPPVLLVSLVLFMSPPPLTFRNEDTRRQ